MKNVQLILGAALLAAGFTACSNSNDPAKADVVILNQYVDSVAKVEPVYTVENWMAIDNGYQSRALNAEKNMAALTDEEKATAEASKAKYADLKAKYEAKLKDAEAAAKKAAATPDYRLMLRNKLFGEGVVGSDMKFGFVTAKNIKDVYEKFVGTVADNKNNYTREDWDEIKTLYEGLDNRKNEVEKDLAGKDNMRIAALKIKFATIKALKRTTEKIEENTKSKE